MAFKAKKITKTLKTPTAQTAAAPVADANVANEGTQEALVAPAKGKKGGATGGAKINRGKTTGMPVMQFQNQLLAQNRKAKLSDEELLDAMAAEFPNAKGKLFTGTSEQRLGILAAVRRLYNAGRHGKQDGAPEQPTPKYVNGQPVADVKTKKAKTAEALAKAS